MVGASDVGSKGREFEPWPVHPFCLPRQNTQLSQCLSPPRCINGYQQIAYKMLGGNLRWTSIPSRGSRNTPSRFILQKPAISAGLMGFLSRPNSIWGRLYLYLLSCCHCLHMLNLQSTSFSSISIHFSQV